ncbi:hypothetical protein KDJ56_05025 [Brevibacillus composti]|uniref:DUF4944 domain-containing protein n=1 Tax=Brevibacillus composti TaxID=2796470 RepID=A0A7T5EMJ7_9BACL|nr:hypothetical protein [Brevibacillus composti]QQE75349.1 hypothetical protein JD108_05345 [Brevibacillus composti]QUO42375.1 hypothetical protein KDJ56_05025 [Brevibacillus composti]
MDRVNRYSLLFGALVIISIGAFFLFKNFLTSQEWSYLFQGSSQQWEGQFIVRPSRDGSTVLYEGKIKPLTPMKITQLNYKTDLVTGQPSGTMESPLIEEGKPIQIFVTSPGHDSIQFRAGLNTEEITHIFFRDLVYEITWNDKTGQHTEKIVLKFVPPS